MNKEQEEKLKIELAKRRKALRLLGYNEEEIDKIYNTSTILVSFLHQTGIRPDKYTLEAVKLLKGDLEDHLGMKGLLP